MFGHKISFVLEKSSRAFTTVKAKLLSSLFRVQFWKCDVAAGLQLRLPAAKDPITVANDSTYCVIFNFMP